MPTRPHWSG